MVCVWGVEASGKQKFKDVDVLGEADCCKHSSEAAAYSFPSVSFSCSAGLPHSLAHVKQLFPHFLLYVRLFQGARDRAINKTKSLLRSKGEKPTIGLHAVKYSRGRVMGQKVRCFAEQPGKACLIRLHLNKGQEVGRGKADTWKKTVLGE